MIHPLVLQLRFTRSEFKRAIKNITETDARKRLLPMNSISWNVGHLAWQEQRYFLHLAQGEMPLPEINKHFTIGAPASTPPLSEMWAAWDVITKAADPWLDTLTPAKLQNNVMRNGKRTPFIFGSLLQRVIYHYWYHLGENMAIRQSLHHKHLPQFVGDIDNKAPYTPERRQRAKWEVA